MTSQESKAINEAIFALSTYGYEAHPQEKERNIRTLNSIREMLSKIDTPYFRETNQLRGIGL